MLIIFSMFDASMQREYSIGTLRLGCEYCTCYTHKRILLSTATLHSRISARICRQIIRITWSGCGVCSTQLILRLHGRILPTIFAAHCWPGYGANLVKGMCVEPSQKLCAGSPCVCTDHSQFVARMCHLNIRRAFSEYGLAYCTEYVLKALRMLQEYCS